MYPRSLLAEFAEVFGKDNTAKFIDVFSGTTIQVPGRGSIEIMERDIEIYEALCTSTSAQESQKLSERFSKKYSISRKRVRQVYHAMQKQMKENKKFKLEDSRVGQLHKSRLLVEHRSKRK